MGDLRPPGVGPCWRLAAEYHRDHPETAYMEGAARAPSASRSNRDDGLPRLLRSDLADWSPG